MKLLIKTKTDRVLAVLLMVTGFVFISSSLSAQGKYLDMGNNAYLNKQYIPAIEYYSKSLANYDGDKNVRNEIIYKLADCYRIINEPKKAGIRYLSLIKNKYAERKSEVYLHYATSLKAQGKYSEALLMYDQYLSRMRSDPLAKAGKASCELSLRDTVSHPRWHIKHLKELNSPDDDFAAAYADNKFSSVLFTSNRKGSTGKERDNWTDGYFSDLYIAHQKGETFSSPKLADTQELLNTKANEGVACFDANYQRLYFTRCEKMDKGKENCTIMEVVKEGDTWTQPIGIYADNSGNVGQPTLTKDGLTMIFASNRPGGKGGKDLWKATRTSTSKPFGSPVNLGPLINTKGDEMFPTLFSDSILYFASNGMIGFGGLDIYRSTITKKGSCCVEHLPRPVNSYADDFAMRFEGNQEKGFFTSRRSGGKGGDDIYAFEKIDPKVRILGSIKDEVTQLPIPKVSVFMANEKKDTIRTITDEKGEFGYTDSQVKEINIYMLTAMQDNYFTNKAEIKIGRLKNDSTCYVNINLQPIPEKPIVLPDIYYELDKWELLPQYQDTLMTLVKILNDNPKLIIELASHTDSRASDKYNDELSQKRAESVVAFLTEKGIHKERLKAKGYGESVPRVLTSSITKEGYLFEKESKMTEAYILSITDLKKREAAFQLNRRTEFSVIGKNFK